MENELKLLKEFEADSVWVKSHKGDLRDEYANQFVAVRDRKVIESDENLEKLIDKLKSKNIDPSFIVIDFVPEKDVVVIY